MPPERVRVPVETRAPGGETNAYLVGERDALLVDPGARTPALDRAVAERDVSGVAATHAHPDHVGAVADYAERTGATVWALDGHEERFEAAAGVAPDRTFSDGDRLPAGDGEATALETPGHAPDHAAFAVPAGVLCGDLAVAEGSVAVAAPEGDVAAYLDSLDRLRRRDPAALYPGHGPVVRDPRATCDRLADHRRERERRIYEAVAAGARDPDAVLAAAYDVDLAGVRDLARATVVAHVERLAAAGRLRWDADAERIEPA